MKSDSFGLISTFAEMAMLALRCSLTHMPFCCRDLRFLASLTNDFAVM